MTIVALPAPGLPGAHYASVPLEPDPGEAHLTEEERALLATLPAVASRRREWCGGRRAARVALSACGGAGVSVLRAPSGAPRLEGPGATDLHLAITHGRRSAAAIATRRDARWPSVGIDLVDAEDAARLERIADRVLKPCERALLARDPRVLLLAWGAREAIAKATRTGMFLFALSRAWVVEVDLDARRLAVNVPGMDLGFAPLEDGGVLVFAGAAAEALAHAAANATGPLDPVV